MSAASTTPGYIAQLAKAGKWPVKNPRGWNPEGTTTTPYLVIPALPGDVGNRPLAPYLGFNSASIDALDSTGNPVVVPVSGGRYTLRCRVANEGAAGSYAGIAEFRVALPSDLDTLPGSIGPNPALGYTGFTVTPGGNVAITCPTPWVPGTPDEATDGILVQVYDVLLDPLVQPFDAANNRQVGRRDFGAMIVNRTSGKCLDVTGSSLDDNATVQQLNPNGGPNQRWIRRPLSGSGTDTVYTLTAQHSNKCLDVRGGGFEDHTPIQQFHGHGGPDQQWTFQPTDDGYFFITSVNGVNQCLNVPDGSLDDGVIVEQLTNAHLDSQKWRLQWVV